MFELVCYDSRGFSRPQKSHGIPKWKVQHSSGEVVLARCRDCIPNCVLLLIAESICYCATIQYLLVRSIWRNGTARAEQAAPLRFGYGLILLVGSGHATVYHVGAQQIKLFEDNRRQV